MIDTVDLLPPGYGPRANPLLFGVSEGLLRLFPLPAAEPSAGAGSESTPEAPPGFAAAPAVSTSEA